MSKQVTFKRPTKPEPEAWVNAEPKARAERIKRLTVDVGENLHRRIKLSCVERGQLMADVIREIMEREFPARRSGKK